MSENVPKRLSPKQIAAQRLLKLLNGKCRFGWEEHWGDRPDTPGRQRAWENRESKVHEQTIKLTTRLRLRLENLTDLSDIDG